MSEEKLTWAEAPGELELFAALKEAQLGQVQQWGSRVPQQGFISRCGYGAVHAPQLTNSGHAACLCAGCSAAACPPWSRRVPLRAVVITVVCCNQVITSRK